MTPASLEAKAAEIMSNSVGHVINEKFIADLRLQFERAGLAHEGNFSFTHDDGACTVNCKTELGDYLTVELKSGPVTVITQ